VVVSIAFRRSPRSRLHSEDLSYEETNPYVSIAFRRSPRSRPRPSKHHPHREQRASPLPFGVHRVPGGRVIPVTQQEAGALVSIAFRRSPRSRHSTRQIWKHDHTPSLHCLSAFTAFPAAVR